MPKIENRYGILKSIKGFAKNKKDGLWYELFEVVREPIIEQKRWFIFKYEEIVGYKQDESEIRLIAFEKAKSISNQKFDEMYTDFNMKEYREAIWTDSITETLPNGPYRVGFSADSDGDIENIYPPYEKSYFTFISVNGLETSLGTTCPNTCLTEGFNCFISPVGCSCKKMKLRRDAFVPAITVCNQRLF